ncbi:MAG: FAD:protein FMN transferase [Flavobacteriales bacterium AspAUS03]
MIRHLYLLGIILLIGCHTGSDIKEFKGNVFGTYYRIKYLGNQDYMVAIDSLFKQFNRSLSTYVVDSDISKINRGDNDVLVDHYFKTVWAKSQEIFKISGGVFDPTLGILVNAWGFGQRTRDKIPDTMTLQRLMQHVGLEKVTLRNGKILKPKESFLDFNGIAKGYAVDVIGQYLEKQGVKNYMIEIGGEISARGEKASGKPWVIGIEKPVENQDIGKNLILSLSLRDRALATSGNYRKFKTDPKTGKKYVHTIDYKTGRPVINNLLSVSTLAKNCMTADGYATTFMVLGIEGAKVLLKTHPELGIEAYFIYVDETGKLCSLSTKNFPNY